MRKRLPLERNFHDIMGALNECEQQQKGDLFMEHEQIFLDGHVFETVSGGFYRALEPYEVNIRAWMLNRTHVGFEAITNAYGDADTAEIRYVATNTTGAEAVEHIRQESSPLDDIGYIMGLPRTEMIGN
jgi:hypothetical protein